MSILPLACLASGIYGVLVPIQFVTHVLVSTKFNSSSIMTYSYIYAKGVGKVTPPPIVHDYISMILYRGNPEDVVFSKICACGTKFPTRGNLTLFDMNFSYGS